MFETGPNLIVVPHADAGDRTMWTQDQDLRPLSPIGREQAAHLAEAVGVVDAVFSSPARRCMETVEPIAAASGVPVVPIEEFRELTYVTEHEAWQPWKAALPWPYVVTAAGLGRVSRALDVIARRCTDGRVAVCVHGDLDAPIAAFAAGRLGCPLPPPIGRGGCFEIVPADRGPDIRSLGALLSEPR
jgi:broad specificity phosphatase PhoE